VITVDERFDLKVDRSAGPGACWPWTAGRYRAGYGAFSVADKPVKAHRYALRRALGRELSPDEWVLHSCDFPPCCNPAHLRVGDHNDNVADKVARGRVARQRGEAHGMARLTADQVVQVRAAYEAGGVLQRELAVRFGVSTSAIGLVVNRKNWSHL
jgi:hypothetical protein